MTDQLTCPECGAKHEYRDVSLADSETQVYRRSYNFTGEVSSICKLTRSKTLTFPCGHSILTVN